MNKCFPEPSKHSLNEELAIIVVNSYFEELVKVIALDNPEQLRKALDSNFQFLVPKSRQSAAKVRISQTEFSLLY